MLVKLRVTVTTCHIIYRSHLNCICEISYCDTAYLIQELIQKFVNINYLNTFLIIYVVIATILTVIINYSIKSYNWKL